MSWNGKILNYMKSLFFTFKMYFFVRKWKSQIDRFPGLDLSPLSHNQTRCFNCVKEARWHWMIPNSAFFKVANQVVQALLTQKVCHLYFYIHVTTFHLNTVKSCIVRCVDSWWWGYTENLSIHVHLNQDLREECLKLRTRVFDLEQQNRALSVLFQQRIKPASDLLLQVEHTLKIHDGRIIRKLFVGKKTDYNTFTVHHTSNRAAQCFLVYWKLWLLNIKILPIYYYPWHLEMHISVKLNVMSTMSFWLKAICAALKL